LQNPERSASTDETVLPGAPLCLRELGAVEGRCAPEFGCLAAARYYRQQFSWNPRRLV